MARKTVHMSICLRGVLNWKGKKALSLFKNNDGSKPTLAEVKEFLYDKLSQGYEVIPMNGVECEGYDKVNGCPGHLIEE